MQVIENHVQIRKPNDPGQSSNEQRGGGAVSVSTQSVGGFEQQHATRS